MKLDKLLKIKDETKQLQHAKALGRFDGEKAGRTGKARNTQIKMANKVKKKYPSIPQQVLERYVNTYIETYDNTTVDSADRAKKAGQTNGSRAAGQGLKKSSPEDLIKKYKKGHPDATSGDCELYASAYLAAYDNRIVDSADLAKRAGQANGSCAARQGNKKPSPEDLKKKYKDGHSEATVDECELYASIYQSAYDDIFDLWDFSYCSLVIRKHPTNPDVESVFFEESTSGEIKARNFYRLLLSKLKENHILLNEYDEPKITIIGSLVVIEHCEFVAACMEWGIENCDELNIMSEQQIQRYNKCMENPIEIRDEMPQEVELDECTLEEFLLNNLGLSSIEENQPIEIRDKMPPELELDECTLEEFLLNNLGLSSIEENQPVEIMNEIPPEFELDECTLEEFFLNNPGLTSIEENQPATSKKRKNDETDLQDALPLKKRKKSLDDISLPQKAQTDLSPLLNQSFFGAPSEKNNTSEKSRTPTEDACDRNVVKSTTSFL